MNVQAKIDDIEYRLNHGIAKYSPEDLLIIRRYSKMKTAFLRLFNQNESIVDSNMDIYNELSLMVTSLDRSTLTKEEYESLCLKIIRMFLKINREYKASITDSLIYFFDLGEETREKIEKIIDEFFKNPNNKFENYHFNTDTIVKLLDYKRYDVISCIPEAIIFDKEVFARLKNECPPNMLSPEIKFSREIDKYNANESIMDLIASYDYYICQKPSDAEEKKADIKKLLYKKIMEATDLSYLNREYSISILAYNPESQETEYKVFDESEATEIAYSLFERNCLLYVDYLLPKNIITQDQVEEKIDYLLDHNLVVPYHLIKNIDDNRFKKIIDQGWEGLEYLVELPSQEENIRRLMPYILNSIKTYPLYDKTKRIDYKFEKYPEIFAALVDKGNVTVINFEKLGHDDITKKALLKVFREKPNLGTISCNTEKSISLIMYLINNGFVSLITTSLPNETIEEHKDTLIPLLLNNVKETCAFIRAKIRLFLKDKETLAMFLGEPIYTEEILNVINHDDRLRFLYNSDIFDKTKDYYARKHNLNINHLERLKERFGSRILRYIENSNLHTIINLNEEEFNKLLNIFPDVTYEMVDLESAYESLIQSLFVIKNPEKLNIFPNFIHAVDDNNTELLARLQEELIINTNEELLTSIIKKYQLEGISTTKELLSLIIQKIPTSKREDYLNILHDLTNSYLTDTRNYFRANYYFDKKYPEYANLCTRILNCIHEENYKELQRIVVLLNGRIDGNIFSQLKSKIPISLKFESFNKDIASQELFVIVFSNIFNDQERDKYLPLLKEIVDYCHSNAKKEFAKEITLPKQLKLPYSFDEKSKEKELLKYLILNCDNYYIFDSEMELDRINNLTVEELYDNTRERPSGFTLKEVILRHLEDEGLSESLALDVLSYYKGGKEFQNDIKEIQKNIGLLVKTAKRIIHSSIPMNSKGKPVYIDFSIVPHLDSKEKIKRIYYVQKPDLDIYQVLLGLKIDLIRENLFNNEEMYNALINLMNKKKIHILPDNLSELLEACNIPFDYNSISGLINFFVPILESEQKRLAATGKDPDTALRSLSSILIQADTYSSSSSVYSQILGPKDARLIKTNPGPNSAYMYLENDERLKKSIEYTINNYKRQKNTIPPLNETFDLEKGKKKIDIIIGNFTDSSNLTHGERTGACMRIGGVGSSLYDFCLKDPNGFHIRFEDPDTHEYISRVSGFRNGNTVFLNELRFSCLQTYSNENVAEACRIAAKKIIELSADSSCPIENVVITKKYAIRELNDEVEYLGITNNKEGLKNFYSDIANNGVVLATSQPDGSLVPIDFDKSKVPFYPTARSKPRFLYCSNDLLSRINRVASIKKLLDGISYTELNNITFDEGIIYGIVSDDWYIYLDYNFNIHQDYISVDERAKEELAKYRVILEEMIKNNKIKVDDEYGLQPNSIRKN